MDMTKIVWAVVVVVILGGGWLFTTGGMNKAYEQATKNLVGNNPEQDVIDEAVLSKYGGYNLSLFRYEQAKRFYSTSINRYGPTGKNYWWNLQQLALCEENMENPQASVPLSEQQQVPSSVTSQAPRAKALSSEPFLADS